VVSAKVEPDKTTLVTGATGGLGQALCAALLANGREVRASGRNRATGAKLEAMGCEFVQADLTEALAESLTADVSTVFHLAAISKPWGRREEFEAVNLHTTKILLQGAKANWCKAFVYASTPSIYSEARDRLGISEDDPPAAPFANDYARTKYLAEQMVLDANCAELATVALRPRAIVGPDDTVLLPRLMRAAERGFMPLPRQGEALIEITDVRDVVDAFLAAEARIDGASGKPFNISGGQPIALKRLLEFVFSALGLKVRKVPMSTSVLHGLGAVLETICAALPGRPEPLLTRYMAKTLSYSQTLDISRARELLGWEPRYSPEIAIAYALRGAGK
jgi:nucleoside-diphosphate-sugar epimerase